MASRKTRIRLVHWNETEAHERADRISVLDYDVTADVPDGSTYFRDVSHDPPDAFVIDLSRLPTQGRDLALVLRSHQATRFVPLIFIEGDPSKTSAVKELLPDATYTDWPDIAGVLSRAIADPPHDPIVPSLMAGYTTKALTDKLGIRQGSSVALVEAPEDFEGTLGDLPTGATISRNTDACRSLTVWFVRTLKELEQGMTAMSGHAEAGPLWIAWAKKASGVKSDVTQVVVRRTAESASLVDYKVASIDKTWSGLLFTRRKG